MLAQGRGRWAVSQKGKWIPNLYQANFKFWFCIVSQRFAMLDKDQDSVLTEDDVMSVPADVVDEAFGQTPPGEVKFLNHHTFLGNCPPTPPLSRHFALREK